MARTKTGDKPKDIRDATVSEVAAVGSTAVSVNKIADRAGLSVGTLYRYHESKDALLFSVFLDVKGDIHRVMMDAANTREGASARLRAMWFALVHYGFEAPHDFMFAEMMNAEIREPFQKNTKLRQMRADVLAEIQAGIGQKILVDAPVETIETLLASPAITLARRAAMGGTRADDSELEKVYALIWRGIAAR